MTNADGRVAFDQMVFNLRPVSVFSMLTRLLGQHALSILIPLFPLSSPADPHIKVCGKRENVREAKDRIMSVLDTKVQHASSQ